MLVELTRSGTDLKTQGAKIMAATGFGMEQLRQLRDRVNGLKDSQSQH